MGGVTRIGLMRTLVPGMEPIGWSTGIAFAVMGAALWLSAGESVSRARMRAATGLVAVVTLFGAIAVFDQFLQRNAVPGGTKFPAAFVLLATSGGWILVKRNRCLMFARISVLLGVFFSLMILVASLFMIRLTGTPDGSTPTILNITSLMFLVSCGVLMSDDRFKVYPILTEQSATGTLARVILPVSIVVPILFGWLRVQTDKWLDTADSAMFLVSALSAIFLWVVIWQVIGIVRRSELRQKEVENERDRFFELSPDMLCIAGFDGYFKQINSKWLSALGYTKDELLTVPYLTYVHQDDIEATTSEATKISDGIATIQFMNRYRHRDGSYRWLQWRANPDSERQQILAVARDVTEQRAMNDALQNAMHEAETANQAKSEFLSRMSHELRTPLNSILGFGQLLQLDPETLDDEQAESVDEILKSGFHLLELIDEVLDIARIESGKMRLSVEPVEVEALIGEVMSIIRPLAAQRNIRLQDKVGDTSHASLCLFADRTRTKQALLNLMSNGVKYNREGGALTLSSEVMPNRRLRFRVTDTGYGIPEKRRHELFQPFSR
ncbi:MAG: PAS domain S-box protein, partial [Candidatus Poribacteria bacterium]|nr:PAS domain S-box protein [Candidatus Poribacteria bacterium]